MNYITTRKIKVVGCLNCPYHIATEKVINEETKELGRVYCCSHPSFECAIPISDECIDRLKSGLPQRMTYSYFPEWCPLEMESVVCCCNPVNESLCPPYRIAHSTFNGETLWAVEKWQPEVQDYGIVQIFTTQPKAEEYLSTLQQGGNINP